MFPLELYLGSRVPHGGYRGRGCVFLPVAGRVSAPYLCALLCQLPPDCHIMPCVPTMLLVHIRDPWPLEIPKGFFYPLEEGLARCS